MTGLSSTARQQNSTAKEFEVKTAFGGLVVEEALNREDLYRISNEDTGATLHMTGTELAELTNSLDEYEVRDVEEITIRYDEEYRVYRVNENDGGDLVQIDESENLEELKEEYPEAEVLR